MTGRHARRAAAVASAILVLSLVGGATPQSVAAVAAVPRFVVGSATINQLTEVQLPYYRPGAISLPDTRPHDATGVRMFPYNGHVYDHPVLQAQFALELINGYRVTRQQAYLDLAKAQADRLILRSVTSRDAMYFPFRFDFPLFGLATDVMRAPWYSAMAQGHALSVFDRLAAITGDQKYVRAAARTFNSFLNLPATGVPWTVFVDPGGYLWLEEYASVQPVGGLRPQPTQVLNGHVFAAFGLLDHWRATADPRALVMLKGSIATVSRYLAEFRTPGWISVYGLRHRWRIIAYHYVHTALLQQLFTITRDARFAAAADTFAADYPKPLPTATAVIAAGTQTGYHFSFNGAFVGSSTIDVPEQTQASVVGRTTFRSQPGTYLLFSDGPLASHWVPEAAGSAFVPGILADQVVYDPPRPMTFPAGTQTGYQFATDGTVTAQQDFVIGVPTVGATTTLAVINGASYRLFVDDTFRGYWFAAAGSIDAGPAARPAVHYPYVHRHVVVPLVAP